jgi:hypothetical protein
MWGIPVNVEMSDFDRFSPWRAAWLYIAIFTNAEL